MGRKRLERMSKKEFQNWFVLWRFIAEPGIFRRNGMRVPPELYIREWLTHKYINQGLTMEQIAKEIGCSGNTVNRCIRMHQLPIYPRGNNSVYRYNWSKVI